MIEGFAVGFVLWLGIQLNEYCTWPAEVRSHLLIEFDWHLFTLILFMLFFGGIGFVASVLL